MTTVKTSVSIDHLIWEQIKGVRNRSSIINQALRLYLDREEILRQAEADYWKSVAIHLKNKTGEHYSLNPNGEEITDELLEEKLWK